ncbi:hypothetical protein [Streptomyces benahoarensis]|uniref:Uncharacterized protein n=1 Tax=Streptomyces benahoarensis TaxID=2595054 RepID=A0A553ZQZ6_9ACTN|nr:hypothetical protein [Streptomyces benahoarensis]TSB32820.1 hypothetical protein FNJ62_00665 [Streptomyces benahoarensis]TSB43853.1 hypothetical protein FNZ23_02020 [Streptomyces benahoarensis]
MLSQQKFSMPTCAWHWEWVPPASPGGTDDDPWVAHLVEIYTAWMAEGLAAGRKLWPEDAGEEFPVTADAIGRTVAAWLRERAGQLPAWSRLAWGAAFVNDKPHWAPVPVVVEFRDPDGEDPNYLLERMGAEGIESDARKPVVEYVTTAAGDGFRLLALGRTPDGGGYGRVGAALRLEIPQDGDASERGVDVLLKTSVTDMGLMAVIGAGVEQLMQEIAAASVPPPGGGRAPLGFVPGVQS